MTLPFIKMHGLGNDFVVIDARAVGDLDLTQLARVIADRHTGVGFDQLVLLGPGGDGAEARVTFLNADGSGAAACGNGARCAAALAMAEHGRDTVTLQAADRQIRAWREGDGLIAVDMGPPALDWRAIPLAREADVDALPLPGAPSAVSMGNPHCVLFVPDAEAAAVARDGPLLETDALFPERANVEFAQVLSPTLARVRVWERGVGVTRACGTGACAVIVAGARRGLLAREATIRLDGGDLRLAWGADDAVVMTGPVARVFDGVLGDAILAAAR